MANDTFGVAKFKATNLEELKVELGFWLRQLVNHLDTIAGNRGTPTIRADLNMTGQRICELGDAREPTDAVRAGQALRRPTENDDWDAENRFIRRVRTAAQIDEAVNLDQLRRELLSQRNTQTAQNAPPEIETSSAIGVVNIRFAREDHTHAGMNLTDAQTAAGAKTFSDNAVFSANVEIDGSLNHDGSAVGFFGTSPAAQASAYTPTNVSTDRSYDANSTTLDEIADVLGTLIADLQSYGLLQ